jgi:hypothetical protein
MRIFASPPLRASLDIAYYLFGKFLSVLFPLACSFSGTENSTGKFGHITFSGNKRFVNDCLTALNNELPKYDRALYEIFMRGDIGLGFYDQDDESEKLTGKLTSFHGARLSRKGARPFYASFFAAGYFGIHQRIWRCGPEGICQFIVFRYFQTLELGQGFAAAIRLGRQDLRRPAFNLATEHMIKWLNEVGYPAKWIDGYKDIRSPEATGPEKASAVT